MVLKDKEDLLDEIRDASRLGYTKRISESIVDRLINSHWCTKDNLLLAYEDLQKPGVDRVILFFQLPFSIRLPDKWIKVKSEYGNPYVRFKSVNSVDDNNKELLSAYDGRVESTQALMSYQLWGERRQQYSAYIETLVNEPEFKSTVLMNWEYSTKSEASRPFTAQTYELDVAKRLLLQTIEILRDFIPLYRVSCKDPFAYIPEKLERVFMMVKTGRVVVREFSESSKSHNRKSLKSRDYSGNLTALEKRLKLERQPSIYETYLLEAARQIELGSPNLAIVQTVMILDWFANEIIEEHFFGEIKKSFTHASKMYDFIFERMWENEKNKHLRIKTREKFDKYLPIIGISLSSILLGNLRDLIKLRDEIVHRKQVEPIENGIADKAVSVGMAVIQHCMDCLISSKKRDRGNSATQQLI